MKKRLLAVLLALTLCGAGFCGCTKDTASDEKVKITVGGWPQESNPAERARYDAVLEQYKKDFPNVEVEGSDWTYNVKAYLPQAAAGQLPTIYGVYFTEIDRIINAGYAADVTEYSKKYGYTDAYSDQIKDYITRDGKQYMVARSTYTMGMALNKNVFKKAGLVNEDGSLMIPQTYDEVMEYSKIIKEKTGAYGFAMATKGNGGGWHFLNLGWRFGTEFEKKVDGEWKAGFGSEECVNALTWLADMKKEGLFPQDSLIGSADAYNLFAADQLAMVYYDPSSTALVENYGVDRNNIVFASLPAGPGGRFAQMGGGVYIIDSNATPAQIEACFKWIEYIGGGHELTEQTKKNIEDSYKGQSEQGFLVGVVPFSIWNENSEVQKYKIEMVEKYANVDTSFFDDYEDYNKVTIRAEEPVNCQELYQVLAGCMQEALSGKSKAEIEKIVKEAADNFERNSLVGAE